MYQNCCKKCGSVALHTETKGNNTGLYCDDCGAFQKWLGKDELRAFEYSMRKATKEENESVDKYIQSISKPIDVNLFRNCNVINTPKTIAKIKLCGGVFTINVDETMQWKKPTDEQIKNLHDMLCIDVEMLGE